MVTGRALERARVMTGVAGLAYAANHGMTLSIDGRYEASAEVAPYVALAGHAADELRPALPGFLVEHTGPNVAIHYRTASDDEIARGVIRAAIAASSSAREFLIREGRKVFELRPPLGITKGTALEALARRLEVGSVLALGDDATDVDMFEAARALGDDGTPARSVAVQSEEAVAEVMEAADYWVDGVEGVEWLLGEVLKVVRSP
jgi:trehalose 6-phosphate synthase/phosphatase